MVKDDGARLRAWAVCVAFVLFSGAVAFGWLREVDLWILQTVRENTSGFLNNLAVFFSSIGGVEVSGTLLLVLLLALLLNGRRSLAGRLIVVFVLTGLVEFAMKLYLPQVPVPQEVGRAEDFAPLVAISPPYPYPSGHIIRGVILLGALCFFSENRMLRAGLVLAMLGLAASRVYLRLHWTSDVVGGALLGVAALLWAFKKEDRLAWRSR